MKPRGEGYENDDLEDPPPDAFGGGVSTVGEDSIAQGIVDLTAEAFKLVIYVKEMDADAFKAIRGRLALFKDIVSQIPEQGRPAKVVGFKAPEKRKRK